MSWEAFAAIGQIVSALALIFVLVQVRHAREELQRSTRQARIEGARELYLAQATHPDLAAAIEQVWSGSAGNPTPFIAFAIAAGLSQSAARQLQSYAFASWYTFELSIESVQRLTSGVREELDRSLIHNYRQSPPFSKWYELSKTQLNPDAVRYVDAVLAREAKSS